RPARLAAPRRRQPDGPARAPTPRVGRGATARRAPRAAAPWSRAAARTAAPADGPGAEARAQAARSDGTGRSSARASWWARPGRRLLRGRRAVSRRGLRRGLRPHGALRLRFLGQLAATPKLDPQRVRERRVERAHGTQPLVTHLLGGDHELLARHAELFRELHQLYLCRHGPLTSSEPFSPLASDGGASITGPPRLLCAPRTATSRNLTACTTPISSLASDGGAPAPRHPA